jgi:IMP and pyridine-specific 5'-nucleotidase
MHYYLRSKNLHPYLLSISCLDPAKYFCFFVLLSSLICAMSFSSRRRNYMLVPHRRDGLIEWMKNMLQHSFVLNALDSTAGDTFEHFEMLIDEHRQCQQCGDGTCASNNNRNNPHQPCSRLQQLVPTVGTFHTALPLRRAFYAYNAKYALTSRRC